MDAAAASATAGLLRALGAGYPTLAPTPATLTVIGGGSG